MLAALLLAVMLAAVIGVLIFAWGYRCGEEHRIVKPIAQSQPAASFFMPESESPARIDATKEGEDVGDEPADPSLKRIPLRI